MPKPKGPTLDTPRADLEFRPRERGHGYIPRMGRSSYLTVCPFCGVTLEVYPWSLAGSGKRCECGAMHGTGQSWHLRDRGGD